MRNLLHEQTKWSSSVLTGYEDRYNKLKGEKKKFDFLLELFDKYRNQSSMALDDSAIFDEEEEVEFEELADFLFEKLTELRSTLFQ